MSILGGNIDYSLKNLNINDKDALQKKADEFRVYLDKLYKEKSKYDKESQDAYKNDKSEEAKRLSDKGNRCEEEINYFNIKITELVFRTNQMKIEDVRLIDVRGLFAKNAIEKIEKRIDNLGESGNLVVVVGNSKLVDSVKSFVEGKKYNFELNKPVQGRITMYLPRDKKPNEKEIMKENEISNIDFPENKLMNDKDYEEYIKKKTELLNQADQLRKEANDAGDEMSKLYDKANEIYKTDKKKAKEMQLDAADKRKEQTELNKKASDLYYQANNLQNDKYTLDLHGQYVNEAMELVEKRLKEIGFKGDIIIVVGAGHHSENNVRKIKPKLEEYLKEKKIKYDDNQPNNGCMTLHLSENNNTKKISIRKSEKTEKTEKTEKKEKKEKIEKKEKQNHCCCIVM